MLCYARQHGGGDSPCCLLCCGLLHGRYMVVACVGAGYIIKPEATAKWFVQNGD